MATRKQNPGASDPADAPMFGYVPSVPGADPFDVPDSMAPARADRRPTDRFVDDTDAPMPGSLDSDLAGLDDLPDDGTPPVPATRTSTPATPAAPSSDPRELARKLADEARARALASMKAAPAPQAEQAPAEPKAQSNPPAAKKSKLADRAPVAPPPAPEPAPAPAAAPVPAAAAPAPMAPEAPKSRLAERAARRPLSATDALKAAADAAAREAAAREAAAREAARPPEEKKKKPRAAAPASAAPAPVPAAAAPATPATDVATTLARFLPGVHVRREVPISHAIVFRALWTAHRARAAASGDLRLLATASVLLDAADRVPAGCLAAAHATIGDRDFAVWVDLQRGVVLGIAEPADIYLAGL